MKRPVNLDALRKEMDLILEIQPNAKLIGLGSGDYYVADFPLDKTDTIVAVDVVYNESPSGVAHTITHVVPARKVPNSRYVILHESLGYSTNTFLYLLHQHSSKMFDDIILFFKEGN